MVLVSGVSWDDPRMSEKQLALALKDLVPVLFVDPPTSVLTPLRKPHLRADVRSRLRVLGPGLARVTPVAPPGVSRPILRDIAASVTRNAIRGALRKLDAKAYATVSASLDDVFDSRADAIRVLWGTDDWVSGAELMGLATGRLRRQEERRLASADLVLSVGEQLAKRWAILNRNVHLFPNGCDSAAFANVATETSAPGISLRSPIAGFVGHISERIDIDMLCAVAEANIGLLLVGPVSRTSSLSGFRALLERENVQWVGRQPFEALPSYMAAMSVGLTPYVASAFNQSSSPLKMIEYLAAGLPVVSSDLPAARALPAGLVEIAATPEDFASATRTLVADRNGALDRARRQEYAQSVSWGARAMQFLQILGHPKVAP